MLKRITLLVVLLFITANLFSQAPTRFWVKFTDKNNTPFTISQPSAFLSQRAIERRLRQNIPVNLDDLPVNPSYIDGVAATGAGVLSVSKWLNSVVIYVADTNILDQIRNLPYVSEVSYVAWKRTAGQSVQDFDKWKEHNNLNASIPETGNPSYFRPKKAASYDYGPSFNQIEMIRATVMHEHGFRGQGMMIAVLDAGFYNVDVLSCFDSLRSEGRLLGTRDFVNPGGNVFQENTHGMSVLSAMAGNVPGQIIGTAPKASYWLLRSEDTGSEYPVEEYFWVAAAEFADSVGVDVINSSLGYTVFDDFSLSYSPSDMNGNTAVSTIGADIAASKGILVVNSAGNSGGSDWMIIGAPSDGDSVLAVGAVDQIGQYAGFSSTGPSADGRIKPDVAVQGEGTIVITASGDITPGNGTSFSSPVLAGAAACLWQAHPQATNMEILYAIQKSSSQFSNPDIYLGYGIPDFEEADKSLYIPPDVTPFSGIILFPNPSRNSLGVKFFNDDYQDISIELYDELGKLVMPGIQTLSHPGENTFQFADTEELPSGIYFLQIKFDGYASMSKWLKM
ncbi:MAG: S8 family serine peptidase [Bacteroidales bacterium]